MNYTTNNQVMVEFHTEDATKQVWMFNKKMTSAFVIEDVTYGDETVYTFKMEMWLPHVGTKVFEAGYSTASERDNKFIDFLVALELREPNVIAL